MMIRFILLVSLTLPLAVEQRPATIDWQPVNAPVGGEALAVAVHGDRLFVLGRGYGHPRWWVSLDRGASWQQTPGRLGDAWSIMAFEGDLLARDFDGLHRTPDFGRTWKSCNVPPHPHHGSGTFVVAGHSIFLNFSNPPVGLWRSRDGCRTWTAVQVPWNADLNASLVHAREAGVLIAGTVRGWFVTTDDGDTWNSASIPAPVPVPSATPGRTTIVTGSATEIFVGTDRGVFRSRDRGRSWSRLVAGWVRCLIVSDGGVIHAAVDGDWESAKRTSLMRSTDGGETWVDVSDGLSGHLINDLSHDGSGNLYAAGGAGVYRQPPSGRWQQVGLPTFFPTFMVAAPWGDLYLGADYGDAFRSTDRGASWRPLMLPNRHVVAATTTRRGDLLVAERHGVLRSRDRGATWEREPVLADEDVRTLYTVPSTGLVLAGTRDGVYRSSDDGQTWVPHSLVSDDDGAAPESFAGGPNGEVFVATSDGSVHLLTGDRWRRLAALPDGMSASALVARPNGDLLAGTTFSLYRWLRDVDLWQPLPLSAEERPRVTSLLIDGNGRLVAGTSSVGAFLSTDGGNTWRPANDRLTRRRIRQMVLGPDGELFAATGSNGLDDDDDEMSGGRLRIFRGRRSR